MDTKEIQREIKRNKDAVGMLEQNLIIRRERLAQAETQLVEVIAAESKKPTLVNGDYGKALSCWVFIGGKVLWEDGSISKKSGKYFTDSRKGNFIWEMEERQE